MELDVAENPGRFFSALARELKSLALSNVQYFQNGKQSYHAKFHVSFKLLYEYLDVGIEPSYRELSKHLHLYDFSSSVKGNGYRSLLRIVQKCCLHLLQLSRYISSVRDSILFRKKFYAKELECYVSALGQLRAVLYYALKLVNYCQDGDLFADESKLNSEIAESLMMEVEGLSQECFFGRCLGFQFCDSMYRPVQALAIAMASYSEGYLESSQMMQVASSVFNSGKYFLDPDLRAQQVVKVTRTADIRFCKAFWGFSESGLMHQLPSFVCPSVEVNDIINLGPDAFELPLMDGSDTVVITPPCAHTGPGHVRVRLISAQLLEGQQALKKDVKSKNAAEPKPRTSSLVIHIHGGGFVAQSSKSHEVYLRHWAVSLGTPILSIDYSLAPELPFPRALEDCFYAYAWAVRECLQLGSTGEKIILVGDSAGGNLAISTAMRAASFGIRRPDGIVAAYPCTLIKYTPSPARLISLLDPILPLGLVSRCLAAYAGINERHPLATPMLDDVHSEQSLSSIQIKSYETSNKDDWIIVAEDEEEADVIRTRTAAAHLSPVEASGSKSVIDSLEDSFSGESASSSSRPSLASRGRSDTAESEEIEIFSRLQQDGSCDLGTEPKKVSPSQPIPSKRMGVGKTVEVEAEGAASSSSPSNFSLFQETAKNVVEGAQTMFSSLSSYMPSSEDLKTRGVMKPLASLLPSSSTSSPTVANGKVESVDLDVKSDSVDMIPLEDLSASGRPREGGTATVGGRKEEGEEKGMRAMEEEEDLTLRTGDRSQVSVSLQGSSSGLSEPLALSQEHEGSNHVFQMVSDEGEGQRIDNNGCGSSVVPDVNREGLAPEAEVVSMEEDLNLNRAGDDFSSHSHGSTKVEVQDNANNLSPDSEIVFEDFSSSTSSLPTFSSQAFNTAPSSPSHQHRDQGLLLFDKMESVSLTSESSSHHTALIDGEKPSIGISPLAELVPNGNVLLGSGHGQMRKEESESSLHGLEDFDHVSQEDPQCGGPYALADEMLSGSGANHVASVGDKDLSCELLCSIPSASDSLSDITSSEQGVANSSSPKQNVLLFSQTELNNCAVSPTALPCLPAESQDLLADALQTLESPPLTSVACQNTGNIFDVIQTQETEEGSENLINCTENGDEEIPDSNTGHELVPKGSLSSAVDGPEQLPPATTAPKPPTSLSLKKTTAPQPANTDDPLTSSSQVFGADTSEPFESVDPDTFFDDSRLEVQFIPPASTSDGQFPSTSRSDSFFRSESAPALSAMLSPLPQQGTSPTASSRLHNGLKTGMSPSDFKRQSFTVQSPLHVLRRAPVVENPYMSPLLASDELLTGLPRVCIVGCHLDPLLDDSIMFARRLRQCDVPVDLYLVDDLPHGFLNFALLSSEAKQASDLCCRKISEML
ncbi:hormone-sensitive lipase [Aplysia californica]|uniref:Hormone-sensitive lipase n=1 Tax=Aplysia californica TaxID=6500 RepID=A0ABM0JGA3_APLCA|nr:hormone-sensitive lipase [Aplysia californica]